MGFRLALLHIGLAVGCLSGCGASPTVTVKTTPSAALKAEGTPAPAERDPIWVFRNNNHLLKLGKKPDGKGLRQVVKRLCPGASPALIRALNADRRRLTADDLQAFGRFHYLAHMVVDLEHYGLTEDKVDVDPMVATLLAEARRVGASLVLVKGDRAKTRSGSQFSASEAHLFADAYRIDCQEPPAAAPPAPPAERPAAAAAPVPEPAAETPPGLEPAPPN